LPPSCARAGEHPAFLSRGYGGRLAGPVLIDPRQHGAREVGDEPLLLARGAPTVVARGPPRRRSARGGRGGKRDRHGRRLQNPSLAKDFGLAVVDGAVGIGNRLSLPAGPLRAPLAAQWPKVHSVLVIGSGAPGEAIAGEAEALGKPVWRGLARTGSCGGCAAEGRSRARLCGDRAARQVLHEP
jgi:tetraacyldisaccharide 4'-kinase